MKTIKNWILNKDNHRRIWLALIPFAVLMLAIKFLGVVMLFGALALAFLVPYGGCWLTYRYLNWLLENKSKRPYELTYWNLLGYTLGISVALAVFLGMSFNTEFVQTESGIWMIELTDQAKRRMFP